jgi:adenylate cyclase
MPFAWTAWWHMLNIGQGWSSSIDDDMLHARANAARAIELDGQNALALAIYGHVKSFYFHEYDAAKAYLERALLASPNSALAWLLTSTTLTYTGCTEEAVRHAEQGLRLSPFDQNLYLTYSILSIAHYANDSFEEAVKWANLSRSDNPAFTANLRTLIAALVALDRWDEVRTVVAELLNLEPGFRLADWEKSRQPFRDPETKAKHVGRLKKSGLPP